MTSHRFFKRSLILGWTLILCSCVKTAYGPSNFKGGYQEVQIAPDRYELAVYGNAYANKQTIRDYFLYRAAELTLMNGGTHFLLFGDKTSKRPITIAGFVPVRGNLVAYGISGTKFGNAGVIKILQEKPEDEDIFYDAQLISSQLATRIGKGD